MKPSKRKTQPRDGEGGRERGEKRGWGEGEREGTISVKPLG